MILGERSFKVFFFFRKCDKDESNQQLYGCDSVNGVPVTVHISG